MNHLSRKGFLRLMAFGAGSLVIPGKIYSAQDNPVSGSTDIAPSAIVREDIESSVDYALQQFDAGYTCAESVLLAVSRTNGQNCECIPHIASGLGGGMGVGEICGAFSGGVLAIGLKYGPNPADPNIVNSKTKEFATQFAEANGAMRCTDIIGFDANDVNVSSIKGVVKFLAAGGPKRCKGVVGSSVKLLLQDL